MTVREPLRLTAKDGQILAGFRRLPEAQAPGNGAAAQGNSGGGPRGVMVLVHGMAEHAARYDDFASFLADNGFAVYAFDLRGHGLTGRESGVPFHFADRGGWTLALEDLDLQIETVRANHPGAPVFLFGHSFGTFLARSYAARYGAKLGGLILSGTGNTPLLVSLVGLLIGYTLSSLRELRAPSHLMHQLSFGRYGNQIQDRRTGFDWLSRDPQEVDKYIADPLCGQVCSLGFFIDMMHGLIDNNRRKTYRSTPADLPLYCFSGTADPVGGYTAGVLDAFSKYQRAGVKDLRLKFYQDGRHEMLNEINKKEVYKDVLDWLSGKREKKNGG